MKMNVMIWWYYLWYDFLTHYEFCMIWFCMTVFACKVTHCYCFLILFFSSSSFYILHYHCRVRQYMQRNSYQWILSFLSGCRQRVWLGWLLLATPRRWEDLHACTVLFVPLFCDFKKKKILSVTLIFAGVGFFLVVCSVCLFCMLCLFRLLLPTLLSYLFILLSICPCFFHVCISAIV